jgi:uncharacterized protein (DUF433 family)
LNKKILIDIKMLLINQTFSVPLKTDANGVIRVNQTRVTLDTVVTAFLEGATAEEIREQYSSLELADIYAVLSYYLQHQTEVNAYLLERQNLANFVQQEAEKLFNPVGIRDRLLARRTHV